MDARSFASVDDMPFLLVRGRDGVTAVYAGLVEEAEKRIGWLACGGCRLGWAAAVVPAGWCTIQAVFTGGSESGAIHRAVRWLAGRNSVAVVAEPAPDRGGAGAGGSRV